MVYSISLKLLNKDPFLSDFDNEFDSSFTSDRSTPFDIHRMGATRIDRSLGATLELFCRFLGCLSNGES